MTLCSQPGCTDPVVGRSLCNKHYKRLRRREKDTLPLLNGRGLSLEDKFLRFVQAADCWYWTGKILFTGYGAFTVRVDGLPRTFLAHRWLWEHLVGPIPDGMYLDHLCLVKHCVNPDHLEPVTPKENNRRHYRRFTMCKRGHPLSGDNLLPKPWEERRHRVCRACALERSRKHRASSLP